MVKEEEKGASSEVGRQWIAMDGKVVGRRSDPWPRLPAWLGRRLVAPMGRPQVVVRVVAAAARGGLAICPSV
jgi:hypothetical protein